MILEEKMAENLIAENAYSLLSLIKEGHDLTVRDDQYEFPSLLDAVKQCRSKQLRFRLVDSGSFDRFQLEWLLTAGADFFTSDDTSRSFQELEVLKMSCQKGGSFLAYFQHQALSPLEGTGSSSISGLLDLGRNGIYVHISNREMERDIKQLQQLAEECHSGGSRLIYYHHGLLDTALQELGRSGAWIHVSDRSIQSPEDLSLLLDILKFLRSSGTNLVLYLEQGMDYLNLKDIVAAGAFVFFQKSQLDYRSPLKELERIAAKRKLDYRAYYLYPTFLP